VPRTTLPHSASIMVIEDEDKLADEIKCELEGRGHVVSKASVAEAASAARVGAAELIIMDRIAFGEDRLKALEAIRDEGIIVPVLVISVLSSIDDKVHGLEAGGDDYLAKPFAMVELIARVEALLRRLDDVRATKLRVGDLEMDLIERTVHCGDTELDLLPREFKLLEFFLRHPRQVITRSTLLKEVWQYQSSLVVTNVIDAHMSNLRKKIDRQGFPSRITNTRNIGYMIGSNA
jgi:two-component system, OmpR family, response regulator